MADQMNVEEKEQARIKSKAIYEAMKAKNVAYKVVIVDDKEENDTREDLLQLKM
jgi:hypothetical protein